METLANATATAASSASSYKDVLLSVSSVNQHLNIFERLWLAWYTYIGNDVLATGLMTFLMHEIFYFGRCIPWMLVDAIPYFQRYKLQPDKPVNWKEQWECTSFVLLTHFTIEAPQIWLFHPICEKFGLATGVPFPSLWTICYQVFIFSVIEDAWHYWIHRSMHYGVLYKYIHKKHHRYSAPFGLAAEYAHPIEVMVLGFGTIGSPLLWCYFTHNLHLVTVHIWVILRLFQAVDSHSGYDFPWSLHNLVPFWAGADHHDDHHHFFIGNYASSYRWWDAVLNTHPKTTRASRKEAIQARNSKKNM